MKKSVVEAWFLLLYVDWLMHVRGFEQLHSRVRGCRVRTVTATPDKDRKLSRAMDLACVFYFKRVFCLQRSAALTVLLRRHGLRAEMILGAQLFPFQSHAWVETDGHVINDKPYITEMFQVLERC
jgi:hypothetical protein